MARFTDLLVTAPPETVQSAVQQAFVSNGFRVSWQNPQQGHAEKGSRGANIALGALAQYYEVDFTLAPSTVGTTLRLLQSSSGAFGGLLGMARVKKQFQELSATLASWFQQNGLLAEVNEGKT